MTFSVGNNFLKLLAYFITQFLDPWITQSLDHWVTQSLDHPVSIQVVLKHTTNTYDTAADIVNMIHREHKLHSKLLNSKLRVEATNSVTVNTLLSV